MKRSRLFMLVAVIALLLVVGSIASISQRASPSNTNRSSADAGYSEPPAAPAAVSDESAFYTIDGILQEEAQQPGQDRLVIRNATLTLVVDNPDTQMDAITALAAEYGGWVVNANAYRNGTGDESQITNAAIDIRIPAEHFDAALERVKSGAASVEYENVTGQDVTQQYVDLSSQLTNLRAAEDQLQIIMDSARRTDDVLSVYDELVSIRGQIEQIQGQIQYYEQSAAYSTINITLRPTPITEPLTIGGWNPEVTARNAFQAVIEVVQGVADVAITVAIFGLPLLVIFGLPAWLVYRRWRQTRRPVQVVSPTAG